MIEARFPISCMPHCTSLFVSPWSRQTEKFRERAVSINFLMGNNEMLVKPSRSAFKPDPD